MSTVEARLAEAFPPLGLRVAAGPLELRGIGAEEALALAEVVRGGTHDDAVMPFCVPWTDADPDELPLSYLQWWWRGLATFSRDSWELSLCVLWEGEVVGIQGVATRDFPTLRFGETGSWLGRRFQGHGIGTAMRQAFCALLFDELGFEFVTSAAFTDNQASIQVSHKVGYRDNGIDWQQPRSERGTLQRMLLLPEDLVRGHPLTVTGAAAMRRLIGVGEEERSSAR